MSEESTLRSEDRPSPLKGLNVVEIGTSVAGPYAGWVLAALGATVIKVERLEKGDDIRHWGPPFWRDTSTMFHTYNRGKQSLEVDLKNAEKVSELRDWMQESGAGENAQSRYGLPLSPR